MLMLLYYTKIIDIIGSYIRVCSKYKFSTFWMNPSTLVQMELKVSHLSYLHDLMSRNIRYLHWVFLRKPGSQQRCNELHCLYNSCRVSITSFMRNSLEKESIWIVWPHIMHALNFSEATWQLLSDAISIQMQISIICVVHQRNKLFIQSIILSIQIFVRRR